MGTWDADIGGGKSFLMGGMWLEGRVIGWNLDKALEQKGGGE